MRIEYKKIGDKEYFYGFNPENDEEMGHIIFSFIDETLAEVFHTDVRLDYRGQKVGERLLYKIVELAREKNIKLLAGCPFVERCYDKIEDIRDVLSKKE